MELQLTFNKKNMIIYIFKSYHMDFRKFKQ